MEDELDESLEFEDFMESLRHLQEEIFWKLRDVTLPTARDLYTDIVVYGDEPVFGALIFDKLVEESQFDPRVRVYDDVAPSKLTWIDRFNREFPNEPTE